ncbi:metal ABC transporter solute-binding protein, Zn/Mn family [Pseudomonas sp. KNUC1026]|uniref:metal ABC transporter solute-binding protein, Zn/Mn family n=1 Tax=Pseudomonas sp. KNUC1026 TaxID=2893890 RepID=UPI001F208D32|nr:zinc ABC transporter substrate-binding protein [Pseudomonas sp. KNUC1026]UFH50385.1 zinc ABC transporter substrate-binding protein [Pseudomonas sp. KNUC1026]
MIVNRLYRPCQRYLVMLALLVSSGVCSGVCSGVAVAAEAGRQQVLVALPALYAITAALSEGTALEVLRLPPDEAVPMESQADALARLNPAVFKDAAAVVTLSSLWRADPLYATARRHNLRIVQIDAARSWDVSQPGVAATRAPSNDVPWAAPRESEPGPSPYAWLGPVNAMRMAAIIAADLERLAPTDAARIQRNHTALDTRLRQLKANYGKQLVAVPDLRVLSLADEFIYLFGEFGIYVDGWFVKQDVEWTDEDLAALSRYLRERDIHVVVHKWQPQPRIAKAIEEGGARLLVLDAGNPGLLARSSATYDALLSADLDALLGAFAAPSPSTAEIKP